MLHQGGEVFLNPLTLELTTKSGIMHHYEDRSEAFRCSVPPELSRGSIRFGWSSSAVQMIDVSRSGFTISVSPRIARKAKQGARFELTYCDEVSEVIVESKERDDRGRMVLKLRRNKDLTRVEFKGSSGFGGIINSISLQSTDPVLSLGVIAGIVLILLICPGLGDDLGTSYYLTDLLKNSIQVLKTALFG